jgi:hypothetical protein
MSNQTTVDCVKVTADWVIPEAFKAPIQYLEILDKFKKEVKANLGKPDENKIVKKLLEELILDNKIKPDYPLTKKNIAKLVEKMWEKFDNTNFVYRYWLLMQAGFFLSTLKPSGFSPESLKLPEKFIKRKMELLAKFEELSKKDKEKAIQWIDKEFNKLTEEVIDYWEKEGVNVVDIIRAKARGSAADIRKMLVAVGLSITSAGTINDVILKSQIEGLEQTQFFHYTSQAIQALYAKSTETALPGYLARKLSTIAEPVVLSQVKDCGSKKYLEVEILDQDVLDALDGRVTNTGVQIDSNDKKWIGKKVKLRSPLYCKAKDGICETCLNPKYVKRLGLKPGARLGLIATTNISNQALVNLTLKKSHTGLSLNLEPVNLEEDIFKYAE